jgi:hypothetical protein
VQHALVTAASISPPYSDADWSCCLDHAASATDSFGSFSDFFTFGAGALSAFFRVSDKNAPQLIHRLHFVSCRRSQCCNLASAFMPHSRAPMMASANQTRHGWAMTEQEERLARDRAEIAARVASFRETQQKFERAREEYYETTLANALNGSGRPSFRRWGGTGRSLLGRCVIAEGIWRVEPQANSIRKCRRENSPWQERSRRFGVFLSSAATLREVKAWKTPSASSNAGGVLHYGTDGTRSRAMRSGGSDHRITQELTQPLRSLVAGRCVMPVWLEILINVMGYAGFIAVATYHRSPNENFPEWRISGSLSAELNRVICGFANKSIRGRLRGARLLLFLQNEQGARFPAPLPC